MTRMFDSDSPPALLTFVENVICPDCDEVFEGTFTDYTGSQSVEDLTVAPFGRHECPNCEGQFTSTMTGWMFYTEAG